MKQSKILRLTFLTLGLVVMLTVSTYAVSSEPAPNFKLVTLEGKMITKESLKGKPTLLMFWASWCQTCQKELPNLKTLYEQKKAKGLQAVAIGFQDEESNIKGYVQAHEATFIFPDRTNSFITKKDESALLKRAVFSLLISAYVFCILSNGCG